MKKLILGFFTFCSITSLAQTTIISATGDGGFETGTTFAANGWTAVNQGTNNWIINTAATAGFSGARCVYISNAGTTHAYTNGTAQVSHFYRDVTIPAGMGSITLTFNWISRGEAGTDDNLKVYLVSTATTPVAGTELTTGLIGGAYSSNNSWTSASISIPCSASGTTQRLVFSWRNDAGGGNNPPAAVDNISLVCSAGCTSSLGTGVTTVSSLPYSAGNGTTCGSVNDLTSANSVSCGSTSYFGGEDAVWIFTPTTSGSVTIAFTSTGSWTGMTLYDGCPLATNPCGGASGSCVAYAQSSSGSQTINACVTAGVTYYLVVDTYPAPDCNAYSDLTISAPTSSTCTSSLGTGIVNVASLPYTSAGRTTCGKVNDITSSNAVVCGSSSYYTGEDEVFIFTPTSSGVVNFTLTSTGSWTGMMLYQGCPMTASCSGSPGTCVANAQSSTGNKTMCASVTAGQTYYLVVDSYASPTCNPFDITISAPSVPTCASAMGTGVVNVASLPYSISGQTTCGGVDDITSSNAVVCGSTSYYTGEDKVYVFTPTASGTVTISLTSTGSYTGLMLYNGCPMSSTGCYSGTSGTCVAYEQSSTGSKSLCTSVTAGTTYYLIVDSYASPSCNPFDLNISAPSGSLAGTICSTAPTITLPYSATGHTTACYGNDYTSTSTGSCGTSYESGEDRVYAFTVSSSQCISINISNASTSNIGFQVYSGCPGTAGTTCIGSAGGSNPLSGSVTVPSAGTYYLVVDTWASPNNATYDISVTSMGAGPSTDLPCNAMSINLGSFVTGDVTCAGSTGEPAAPSCWTSGTNNSIWFSFTAPASGQVRIRTQAGTLTSTQLALYSGTCGPGLSFVTGSCNTDAADCGGTSNSFSDITVTGLTSGATYYVRCDGQNSLVGNFDLIVVDATVGLGSAAGQDCSAANPVCASTLTVGNPGYQSWGYTCDLPTSYCLASGERNVVWYTVNISSNGNLNFDIVPNDFGNPNPITGQTNTGYTGVGAETDYDFGVWRTTGSGAVTCSQIAAGTATPLRCNYSGLGVTGLSGTGGNAPAAYAGFDASYETQLAVNAGDVILIAVSNFSSSTSGFSLDFSATTAGVINYTGVPSQVIWTGGAANPNQNNFNSPSNWGGCTSPSCSANVDAILSPSSTNQPVLSLTTPGTYTARNVTINPGATLTINAGCTLEVCGNFTNNGNLVCASTATIIFNGTGAQNIAGSLTGVNKFGNLVVTKTSGTVNLMQDIDIGGNFITSNNTSIFNSNGNYIRVAGNFTNANGNTTFTNTGSTGTLEFNGTSAQTYNQGSSNLDLNYVLMNHTGTGVTLASNMRVKSSTGTLTLTAGKIITTGAYEVYVLNTTPACVSVGNTSSYVQGYLRRAIAGTGAFEFPLGEATKGYERATLTFTAATSTINNIRGEFQLYASVPAALGVTDCTIPYNLPALDCGKWRMDAYNSAGTQVTGDGTYDITLYPRVGSYTNGGTANEWTVMKDPNSTSAWGLYGTCNLASGINQVMRSGLTGFSSFGVAQSSTALPVELLEFTGEHLGKSHLLKWTTITEINNDYFILESSENGYDYYDINRQEGAISSNTLRNYSYQNIHPSMGVTYYRLKQVNIDGSYSYSNVVVLENTSSVISVSNIHPNPTTGDFYFDFGTTESGLVSIELYDMYGKIVYNKKVEVESGLRLIEVESSQLSRGVYTLRVSQGVAEYTSVHRVVKN